MQLEDTSHNHDNAAGDGSDDDIAIKLRSQALECDDTQIKLQN